MRRGGYILNYKKNILILFSALFLLFLAACSSQGNSDGEDFPKKDIEIVAPASPGGGWDTTARSVQKVFEDNDMIGENINVENKPGGNGETGFNYIQSKDAHTLAVNSSLLLSNNLLGDSKLTYEDFTPLAILTSEYDAIVTPKESDFDSIEDVMEQLEKDPGSLNISVAPGLGSDNHLGFVEAALDYDIDPAELNFIVEESGGDQLSAVLGNHIDVASMYISEVADDYEEGELNVLGVASEKRLDNLEDIPTLKEEGVDVVFPHWRGIMGPPDMSEEEIEYWDEKIKDMVDTDEWEEVLENNEWEDLYKDSEESKEFLDDENQKFEKLLEESNLLE